MTAGKITVQADLTQLVPVTAMINRIMGQVKCPQRTKLQITVAIDEIFSNIVHYAYNNKEGTITVEVETEEDPPGFSITFVDQGIPFNPLTVRQPEVTGPAKKRAVGGLGIFIVKNTMDKVYYEYKNGCNVLTLEKTI